MLVSVPCQFLHEVCCRQYIASWRHITASLRADIGLLLRLFQHADAHIVERRSCMRCRRHEELTCRATIFLYLMRCKDAFRASSRAGCKGMISDAAMLDAFIPHHTPYSATSSPRLMNRATAPIGRVTACRRLLLARAGARCRKNNRSQIAIAFAHLIAIRETRCHLATGLLSRHTMMLRALSSADAVAAAAATTLSAVAATGPAPAFIFVVARFFVLLALPAPARPAAHYAAAFNGPPRRCAGFIFSRRLVTFKR